MLKMNIKKLPLILSILIAVMALDQLTKLWVMDFFAADPHAKVLVTFFFDLVLVYNKGVSFGLLSHMGPLVFWGVTVISSLIILGLGVWVLTEKSFWNMVGLSLILGGALGNMIDRVRLEAVVDFLYFHWGPHYWPAFNVADSAIVVGVGLLIWQQFCESFRKKD